MNPDFRKDFRLLLGAVIIVAGFFFLFLFLKPNEEIDFTTHVKPILNKHCISCHGGVKRNAGFSVLFESEAMAITNSGKPAIIRGNARKSELIKRLHHSDPELRMPYQKSPLSEDEIKILTDWINQGAKWGTHWAYQSVDKTEIPQVTSIFYEKDFITNPIDHFIAARMEEKNLLPNPPAQKNIIGRRLSFDVTGLPPNANLFESFVKGQITYENYLDSLFSESAYGEKWASWWLDLARYADSKGYETDRGRSIWKYRDWVINSFNENMPFDQFTIEQLAGDLLPQPTYDQLIATAFHRNTMNNDEGGTDDEEFRVAAVIDRVNTSFDVWQSTTISCVQCHSHPYDPIKHDEYYKLMAFFNNTMDEDLIDESPNLKDYSVVDQKEIKEVLEWIKLNADNKIFELFKKFIQFQEPKYPAHDFSIVNIEKDLATINGLWLALRNGGEAVLENFDTQGYENLYFMHDSKPDTKLYFRINDNNGNLLAEVDFKPDFKNESDNEIGEGLNYFDPLLKIKKVRIPKIEKPFNLYLKAINSNIVNAKKNKNVYQSDATNIIWVTTLPDLPVNSTKKIK